MLFFSQTGMQNSVCITIEVKIGSVLDSVAARLLLWCSVIAEVLWLPFEGPTAIHMHRSVGLDGDLGNSCTVCSTDEVWYIVFCHTRRAYLGTVAPPSIVDR